jgi:mRNA-degrading endonuclease RelE of RelBE toxin-antitoxin system
MSYNVIPTPNFKSQAKRLIKKFPSLRKELADLSISLSQIPASGTPLGNDTFKVRIAVKSKGKGKSGGMRVITFKIDRNKELYLLTIYDKSEIATVDDRALKFIIRQITGE